MKKRQKITVESYHYGTISNLQQLNNVANITTVADCYMRGNIISSNWKFPNSRSPAHTMFGFRPMEIGFG